MVYCSAVDYKSNSSRRKEDINIYISFGLPRDRDLKRKWISPPKRATLAKEESITIIVLLFYQLTPFKTF